MLWISNENILSLLLLNARDSMLLFKDSTIESIHCSRCVEGVPVELEISCRIGIPSMFEITISFPDATSTARDNLRMVCDACHFATGLVSSSTSSTCLQSLLPLVLITFVIHKFANPMIPVVGMVCIRSTSDEPIYCKAGARPILNLNINIGLTNTATDLLRHLSHDWLLYKET